MNLFHTSSGTLDLALIREISPKVAARIETGKRPFNETDVRRFKSKALVFFQLRLNNLVNLRVQINEMDHSSYGACDGHEGLNSLIDIFVELVMNGEGIESDIRGWMKVPKESAFRSRFLYPDSYGYNCYSSFEDYSKPWEDYFRTFLLCACGLHKAQRRKEVVKVLAQAYIDMLDRIYNESYIELGHYIASSHPETDNEIEVLQNQFCGEVSLIKRIIHSGSTEAGHIAEVLYDEFIDKRKKGRVERLRQELVEPDDDWGELEKYIRMIVTDIRSDLLAVNNEMAKMLLKEFSPLPTE